MSKAEELIKEDDISLSESMLQVLIFAVGSKQFALDITQCRDVNKNIHLTEVPKAESHIAGIVNIRGEIITVFDLANLLSYRKESSDNPPVIIRIKYGNGNEAIRADRIVDITKIPKASFEDASMHLSELEAGYIEQVALLGNQLVLFIDGENLLNKLAPNTDE